MFRTSNFKDKRLRAIISKELLNGFDEIFLFRTQNTDIISDAFELFCANAGIVCENKMQEDLLLYKIWGMYKEIADPDYLYTFDEHGEWLLYKILVEAAYRLEDEIEAWESMDHKDGETEPTLEDIWDTALSKEEIEYVCQKATEYMKDVIEEILWDDEDADREAVEEEYRLRTFALVQRMVYFPLMIREISEYETPEFLFWDTDFMFLEDFGPENFEKFKNVVNRDGMDFGFSAVDETTQMYTGSSRFEFDEE